jgi:hypothetical protein
MFVSFAAPGLPTGAGVVQSVSVAREYPDRRSLHFRDDDAMRIRRFPTLQKYHRASPGLGKALNCEDDTKVIVGDAGVGPNIGLG